MTVEVQHSLVAAVHRVFQSLGQEFRPGRGIESEAHGGLQHSAVLLTFR